MLIIIVFPINMFYWVYIWKSLKIRFIAFTTGVKNMKILGLASFTNGTMNLPKEVRDALHITESKGKLVFYIDNGKVIVDKA